MSVHEFLRVKSIIVFVNESGLSLVHSISSQGSGECVLGGEHLGT